MTGMLVVNGRNAAQSVEALGMRCNPDEVPDPLDDRKCEYFAGMAHVSGEAPVLGRDDVSIGEAIAVRLTGLFALAVGGGNVYGIVAPLSPVEPAAWFSGPVSELSVTAHGSEGMLRKRPRELVIAGDQWQVTISDIAALFRSSGRYQTGQAKKLHELLA